MLGFDRLFDFDRNGRLDAAEKAAQYQFMMDEKYFGSFDDEEDEEDIFGAAGLDYEELEFMDPGVRRGVLEDAGLDPDEFAF